MAGKRITPEEMAELKRLVAIDNAISKRAGRKPADGIAKFGDGYVTPTHTKCNGFKPTKRNK